LALPYFAIMKTSLQTQLPKAGCQTHSETPK